MRIPDTLFSIGRQILPTYVRKRLNKRLEHVWVKRDVAARIRRLKVSQYVDVSSRPDLNVIIVVVDSLRNTSLSCRGHRRETTPFLDSLESRFTAVSASSWTCPSVASILTGLYPHNHNVVLAGKVKDYGTPSQYQRLRDDVLTLPEILSLFRYRTYFGTAISMAYHPMAGRVVSKTHQPSTLAAQVLDDASKEIKRHRGHRFFAYVQLADLHVPLIPPDSHRSFFGDVKDLPKLSKFAFTTPEEQRGDPERFREYRENRQLLYDNILRYVDSEIERFHRRLKDQDLLESTVLIITADHGEEFWDHAEMEATSFHHQKGCFGIGHGHSAFNELIQVPILITGPVSHRRPDFLVSTVDIVPTVLDFLGIRHSMRLDGQSALSTDGIRPLLSEASATGYEKKALIMGRYKLVYSKDDGVEWLFDLEKDPYEQNPIVDKALTSPFVEKLKKMLEQDERTRIRRIAAARRIR
jgi:arylsulfatase A-like enzyme